MWARIAGRSRLRSGDGRLYVGPDNGLLVPAAERMGGLAEAWELTEPAYRLAPISRTFHGRDVFAPAAAFLAGGLEPACSALRSISTRSQRLNVPVAADLGE